MQIKRDVTAFSIWMPIVVCTPALYSYGIIKTVVSTYGNGALLVPLGLMFISMMISFWRDGIVCVCAIFASICFLEQGWLLAETLLISPNSQTGNVLIITIFSLYILTAAIYTYLLYSEKGLKAGIGKTEQQSLGFQ